MSEALRLLMEELRQDAQRRGAVNPVEFLKNPGKEAIPWRNVDFQVVRLLVKYALTDMRVRVVEQFVVGREDEEPMDASFVQAVLGVVYPENEGGRVLEIPSQGKPGVVRQFVRLPP